MRGGEEQVAGWGAHRDPPVTPPRGSAEAKRVDCAAISDDGWGWMTSINLPGAGTLGIYQAKHPVAFG